jgi:prepilin signal peptidase PulO-like enzyme (type II secretory pathway)
MWLLILVSLFIVIALYDARNMEIPLVLLLTGVGLMVVYALCTSVLTPLARWDVLIPWRDMFWGGSIAAMAFYALVYFSHETWMGMGDVWLAGIAGAAVGLPALLLLSTISFGTGALVGVVLLSLGRKGMKSQLPFAPFLVVGTLVTLYIQVLNPWWLTLFLLPV